MFFTFESLFLFGLFYLISLPISFYTFKMKKSIQHEIEDEHEDVLWWKIKVQKIGL